MNVERFLLYSGWLLGDEDSFKIQERLEKLRDALSTLASSPAEPSYQNAVSSAFTDLKQGISALLDTYDTVQSRKAERLGWAPYFTHALTERISGTLSTNAMTPAVAQQNVAEAATERAAYLKRLREARASLRALNFSSDSLAAGEAEVGFELPRAMFDNELGGLVEELRAVRRIVRVFSELENRGGEPIVLRQISTTDPIFYFGLDPTTIAMIGGGFTWALTQWKMIEDIRKVRADTKKISGFTEEAVRSFFDTRIETQIKEAIAAKTNELIPSTAQAGRAHEQRTEISWALEAILARVERGMTVDIRFSLPPKKEADGHPQETPAVYEKLEAVTQELSFPEISTDPVLALPRFPGRQPTQSVDLPAATPAVRRRRRLVTDTPEPLSQPEPATAGIQPTTRPRRKPSSSSHSSRHRGDPKIPSG